MTNKHSLFAVVLGALLAGCASDSQTHIPLAPPTNAEICCSAYSEFPFATLKDNDSVKFVIDELSPVAHFKQGNSHFSAFTFNERSGDVKVTLSSLFVDDHVFAPEVVLLDHHFQPVEHYSLADFQTVASDAFTRTRYLTQLKLNATETPYLIVYTSADQLGKKVKVDHPAKVRAKEMGAVMPMVTDPVYTHQLAGRFEMEVETTKMRALRVASAPPAIGVSASSLDEKAREQKFTTTISPQPETEQFYLTAIEQAVRDGDIPKALSLLDEAKALNVNGAQKAFVKAVNAN